MSFLSCDSFDRTCVVFALVVTMPLMHCSAHFFDMHSLYRCLIAYMVVAEI